MKAQPQEKMLTYNHQPNSIELVKTAKGEYTWKIKRYAGECQDVALNWIKEIDAKLRKEYRPNEN